jgi:bifunctional N-acetylglucosamine-1-phosphate-uridyltransferase/glucosamine-1-phosphate-acetyltransferase GlmU-like protein
VPQGKFVQAEKVNPSLYVANTHWLRSVIPDIPAYDKGDGFPPERLMQSVIPLAYRSGKRVTEVHIEDYEQALGVNTKAELREVRKVYAARYEPRYAYMAA